MFNEEKRKAKPKQAEGIATRRQVDENLWESERAYRTLCDNISGMVYRGRPDWSTEVVSNSEKICGYSPEEFNSKEVNWLNIVHPDDKQRVFLEASVLEGETKTLVQNYRIIDRNGHIRWVEDHKTLYFVKADRRVDGVVFDITDKKMREIAIKESEERYKALYQGAVEGILVVDIETKEFKYANPAICRMLGYTEKEIETMSVRNIHPEENWEYVFSEFEALARGEKTFSPSIPCLRKDGAIIYANINSAKIVIDGRECNVGFFTDVTERKRIEDELEKYKGKVFETQRYAYIGSMGAITAHQISQPLTKINILLDRALDNAKNESCWPSVIKDVKEGLAEVKKVVSIIRKFRQYSKSSALEGVGEVNLSAVADRIVSVLSQRAKQAEMHISAKGLANLPEVETNEVAWEQIFLIIIQNAIEAADDKKRHKLDIAGKIINGNIELQFSDDCCGIAPENIDRIFEPFFSTKTEDKGMGLGLDIVQQILISYGGKIRVESELGKGTVFYVTLPVGKIRKPRKHNEDQNKTI